MLGLQVPLKDAEKWKNFLIEKGLFNKSHYYVKDKEHIYFPLSEKFDLESHTKSSKITFVDKEFPKSVLKGTLKENLTNSLTKDELAFVKTAHDTIGTIAIVEIPKDLEKREKIIAETLLKVNPQIKTVLKKADIHGGVFRTQKMTYLAGVETKETLYKENNVILKLDVERVYFSVRLSNERKRIMELVKPDENILVMFSGCAPYPIVLAKNTQAKRIIGIEINPAGHEYGMESLRLNKIKNVELLCGDVHEIIPMLKDSIKGLSFDRIIMPLPKTADEFLDDALSVARKGTLVHFYDFLREDKFDEAVQKIDTACKKRDMKYKVHDIVRCGQHAPYIFRICVDFEIL